MLSTSDFAASVVDGSIPLPHLFQRRFGLGSNLCVRRSLLHRIGEFDESLSTGEDIDFALRVAAVAPLRKASELAGSGAFSPLWAGQNASGPALPAAQLTRALAGIET